MEVQIKPPHHPDTTEQAHRSRNIKDKISWKGGNQNQRRKNKKKKIERKKEKVIISTFEGAIEIDGILARGSWSQRNAQGSHGLLESL